MLFRYIKKKEFTIFSSSLLNKRTMFLNDFRSRYIHQINHPEVKATLYTAFKVLIISFQCNNLILYIRFT